VIDYGGKEMTECPDLYGQGRTPLLTLTGWWALTHRLAQTLIDAYQMHGGQTCKKTTISLGGSL
jgi:hypothetical protein